MRFYIAHLRLEMQRNRRKRITLAVLCALPFAAQAEENTSAAEGIRLKPQLSLLSDSAPRDAPLPVFIDADQIRGHTEKEIEARGNVQLRRPGQLVLSDRLLYDTVREELDALGNVRLETQGDVVVGDHLRYNTATERGFMERPVFRFTPMPRAKPGTTPPLTAPGGLPTSPAPTPPVTGRGNAERMLFQGPDLYRVEQGSYTTCGPGNDDWFLRADELDIDKNRDIGIARGASVVFFDRTIFYTPYISFALHQQRKSGFLTPHYGTATTTGTEFTLPYYWNIAPNRDATFYPRVMTKRGLQLGTELRYLDTTYRGTSRFEWLPEDRELGRQRYGLFMTHAQTFSNGWAGSLNVNRVSDDRYFTDLSTLIALTSRVTLPNEAILARGGAWGQGTYGFSVLAQTWQTLQTDPLAPITPPYNRVPQVTLTGFRQDLLRSDLDVTASYVDFQHPTLVNGRRFLVYPSVAVPFQSSAAYFKPKIGFHATQYLIDNNPQGYENTTRTLPIFSAESGLVFERDMRLGGTSFINTLEPKIFYVYIPFRDQSRIPNFESGQQDISFATIFTENQFSGSDRINDANQVTVGVTSRFIHPESGIERLRVALAQRYYFQGQRVTLPGVPPRADQEGSSDLLAALSGTILPHWTAEIGLQYSTDQSQSQKTNIATRYQPEPGKVLNLAYRNTTGLIRQTDVSFQWPVASNWRLLGRWNYSFRDSKTLEALAGFEYDGGCWAFRAVAHRFVTALTTVSTSYYLQLELNGLSKIGSNTLSVLRRNVGGYTRLNPQEPGTSDYDWP